MDSDGLVVVGASYAGTSFAFAARKSGYTGPIRLFTEERHIAYDVPFLSKRFLLPGAPPEIPPFRSPALFERAAVSVRSGAPVVAIDRIDRSILLNGGERVRFDYLMLATGATPLIPEPFVGVPETYTLKTREDAERILARLDDAPRVAIIGGGVLGCEAAYALRRRGLDVMLIERAERCMSRQITPALSVIVERKLREEGVALCLNTTVSSARSGPSGIAIHSENISRNVDLLLICAGARPGLALARDCGLPVDRGILVNRFFRTGDSHILASGDCIQPLEASAFVENCLSVQHATETGRQAAEALVFGRPASAAVPTFWFALGDDMVRMAGYYRPDAACESVGDKDSHVSVQWHDGTITFVETLNDMSAYLSALKAMKN